MTKEENIHLCLDDVRERNDSAAISIDNSVNSKAKSRCSQLYYGTQQESNAIHNDIITEIDDHSVTTEEYKGEHEIVCVKAENSAECTRHNHTQCNNDKNSRCSSSHTVVHANEEEKELLEECKLLESVVNNAASFTNTSINSLCDKQRTWKNDFVSEETYLESNKKNLDTYEKRLNEEQKMEMPLSEKEEQNNDSNDANSISCSVVSDHHHYQKDHNNHLNHHHHHHNDSNVEASNCVGDDQSKEVTCVKQVDCSNDEEINLLTANAHYGVFTREYGTTRMNNTINKASKAVYFWGSLVATAVPGYLGKKTGLTSQFLHWNYIIPHLLLGAIPIVTQVGASGDHLDQLRRQLESRHETLGLVVACLEDDELNGFGMNFIQFAKEVDWRREVNRHVEYLKVTMEDTKAAVKLESVVDAVEKLHTCIDLNKETAYVHCKAGKGRSWMIVMCYLTTYGGLPFDCAARLVQDRRVQINPSLAQQCFAREFAVRVAQNNLLKHSYLTSHLQQHEHEHECQHIE